MALSDVGTRLRVLVIDDNVDDLRMFSLCLESLECDARTSALPEECLAISREFQPHLVFLDLAMPGTDGFAVARQLQTAGLPPFLLVARTGYSDERTKEKCLTAGFNLVVIKPEKMEELKRLLEAARRLVEV